MGIIQTLYNRYNLMFLCILGTLLIAHKLRFRKYFYISLPIVIGLNIFFTWAWRYFFHNFGSNPVLFLRTSRYLIQYLFCFALAYACFKNNIISSIFCATCGYTTQHLVQRTHGLITRSFTIRLPFWATFLLWIGVGIIVFMSIFFFLRFSNGKDNRTFRIRRPGHIIIATLGLAVMIAIENEMLDTVLHLEKHLLILNFVSSIVFAVIVIILEFNLLMKENYFNELTVIKQIAGKEHEHYELEKTLIDTINIKTHDLKHQINAMSALDQEEINSINSTISAYDSNFKTGNTPLDVILTSKGMICSSKNIEFTALLDGAKLSFIKDSDLYTLFGNILDNAITGVENLEDQEKRVISLSMFTKADILFVRCENYYKNTFTLINGIPQTTKENKEYHGFGLKSIMMIVDKYDGDVNISFDNDIFALDMMFFTNKKD